MKFRPYAATVAAFATAAISLTVIAPAQAAATDPVTNLAVTQSQVGQQWALKAAWTPNDTATTYKVVISDDEAATSVVKSKDVTANQVTLSTEDLTSGADYWIAVRAKQGGALGTTKAVPFKAIALDTTGPTGTYKVSRTTTYLAPDFESEEFAATTIVMVTQTSQSSDTVSRTIEAGDGSPRTTWSKNAFNLTFHKVGTFIPKVLLTDKFGNVTTVSLAPITVTQDSVGPQVQITTPANPTKVASWRRIKGTAVDAGTDVHYGIAFVAQKRGKIWHVYDFRKKKWIKGYSALAKTVRKSNANPGMARVDAAGKWQTAKIKGLRKGRLHVRAYAVDAAFNFGEARRVNRVLR